MQKKQKPKLTLRELRNKRDALRVQQAAAVGVVLPQRPERPPPAPRPPPPVPEPPFPGVVLGQYLELDGTRLKETGRRFGLTIQDLYGGMWVLGKAGFGKTLALECLATGDILAGRGCIVLDPAGDLIENLIARVPPERERDVVLLDAGDTEAVFGLNPVGLVATRNTYQITTASVMLKEAIRKAGTGWGSNLEVVIPNAAHLLLANPDSRMADMVRLFTDDAFRERLLESVSHQDTRTWWQYTYAPLKSPARRQLYDSTVTRINSYFLDANLGDIVNAHHSLDFPTWINGNKIVLIKLPSGEPTDAGLALSETSLALIGGLIMQLVKAAAYRQVQTISDERSRPLVPFYVDEFALFATPDFGTMYRQLRKSGIIPVLAHQDLAQLPGDLAAIPRAARHFLCFGVTGDDAPQAVKEFHPERQKRGIPVSLTPFHDIPRRMQNGHAVWRAHRIEEEIDEAILYRKNAIRNQGDTPISEAFELYRSKIENALNRYLVAAMRGDELDFAEFDLELALQYLLSKAKEKRILEHVKKLAEILAVEPVYPTNTDILQTDGEAKRALANRLTGLEPHHAYVKVLLSGTLAEHFVRMVPPPWPLKDAEFVAKRARIRQRMLDTGITQPRHRNSDGASPPVRGPRNLPQHPENPGRWDVEEL